MTTVGVNRLRTESKIPLKIPNYAFKYPSSSRVHLSSVKRQIFNPFLPSFRNIDRDTHMNKLPYEHCQTSTWKVTEDNNKNIALPRRQNEMNYFSLKDINENKKKWSDYLSKCQEVYELKIPELQENSGNVSFSGYSQRYLRPETSFPKFKLADRYSIDNFGRQPSPVRLESYRDKGFTHTQRKPWRNP